MLDPTGQLLRDLERRVEALERRRQLAARSVQLSDLVTEPWHVVGAFGEPAFQGTWAWYGSPWGQPRFALIGGLVHVKGLLTNPAAPVTAQTIFVLPAGYRPGAVMLTPVKILNAMGRVDVQPTGELTWNPDSTGFNNYVSLDSIPPFYPEG